MKAVMSVVNIDVVAASFISYMESDGSDEKPLSTQQEFGMKFEAVKQGY